MIGKWCIIKETNYQFAKDHVGKLGKVDKYCESEVYKYHVSFTDGTGLMFNEEEFIIIESKVIDALYGGINE